MKAFNYKRTKYTCYFASLAMASAFVLPPLLFATFKELYGISYTLLGTLVLVNFCTQLGMDLILSFFSHYFNIHKTIRTMPLITAAGLCVYALVPFLSPQYAYIGLVCGTFIFSVASGLAEVLVSPTVAALPSDTPDKDMSMLHSLYGYGFVGVVLISTMFLHFIGNKYWVLLTLFWAIPPVIASVMLIKADLPDMKIGETISPSARTRERTKGLILCGICIFLGGSAENTMSNWISAYTENALHLPKIWGDLLGTCLFAAFLALTRTAYSKFGKNIFRTLTVSMLCSVLCYITIALSPNATLSLIACVALGVFSAMLWPGTLILMEKKIPAVGVAAYALMAAGGDLGASVAPQLVGIVVDNVSITDWASTIGSRVSLSAEQIGFKAGMLMAAVFPMLGCFLLLYMKRFFIGTEAALRPRFPATGPFLPACPKPLKAF